MIGDGNPRREAHVSPSWPQSLHQASADLNSVILTYDILRPVVVLHHTRINKNQCENILQIRTILSRYARGSADVLLDGQHFANIKPDPIRSQYSPQRLMSNI